MGTEKTRMCDTCDREFPISQLNPSGGPCWCCEEDICDECLEKKDKKNEVD